MRSGPGPRPGREACEAAPHSRGDADGDIAVRKRLILSLTTPPSSPSLGRGRGSSVLAKHDAQTLRQQSGRVSPGATREAPDL